MRIKHDLRNRFMIWSGRSIYSIQGVARLVAHKCRLDANNYPRDDLQEANLKELKKNNPDSTA